MQEGQRQAYLTALGLPLWSARQPLPGALPAVSLEAEPWLAGSDVAAAEAGVAGSTDQHAQPVPPMSPMSPEPAELPPSRPQVREAAPPSARTLTPARTPLPSPAPAKIPSVPAVAGSADFPVFNFWFKTLPGGWQLLIALPGDVPDLSAREHQLLAQIEAVLAEEGGSAPVGFRWPLNNNPAIPRDAQSAGEAVGAFLTRQRKPDSRWVLLGAELLPYVEAALAGEKLAWGGSLRQLLDEPAGKLALWRSLCEILG